MAASLTKRLWTIVLGAGVALSGTSLGAQTAPTTNNATTAPPVSNDVVGPEQLRDFRLPGTVTQRADPPAATTTAPPPAPTARTAPPRTVPAARAPEDRSEVPTTAARPSPTPAPVHRDEAPAPAPQTIAPAIPGPSPVAATPTEMAAPVADPAFDAPAPVSSDEGSNWPWLLAALAALLGGALILWQRRSRHEDKLAFAGAPAVPEVQPRPMPPVPPAPRPATPVQRAPAPAPAPSPSPAPAPSPVPGGIVARGLRPSLSFELQPLLAETDGQNGAALVFDVVVHNNGSAPARDVLIESRLINAGPRQDDEIGRFFLEPEGEGERLPMIPPMSKATIRSRRVIPGDEMVPVNVEGRSLFVPLIGFNARYRWSGGQEQDSASFLVGRGAGDEGKLAPIRLDQGPKSFSGLAARQHSLGLER